RVPQGYSLQTHADFLACQVGAEHYLLMPAKRLFALGVGHIRRRDMRPGSKSEKLAEVIGTEIVHLSDLDWRVLIALKREFEPDELCRNLWKTRADEVGVDLDTFYEVARSLSERRVIGRFSTFLEHVKPVADNQRVTRYN